jgi:hypothetical protein
MFINYILFFIVRRFFHFDDLTILQFTMEKYPGYLVDQFVSSGLLVSKERIVFVEYTPPYQTCRLPSVAFRLQEHKE